MKTPVALDPYSDRPVKYAVAACDVVANIADIASDKINALMMYPLNFVVKLPYSPFEAFL